MRLKDDNKATLIREKAIEMIVKQGFDGLSMHKLAKAVGISASTIYVYFKNREDLLNSVYNEAIIAFEEAVLRDFDPEMGFEEGLWLQWTNRYKNIVQDPLKFHFLEQFRNSPLIKHQDIRPGEFRVKMQEFVATAVKKKEIQKLPLEIFWAMAYGPFYTLIKFELDQSDMSGKAFSLDQKKLKQAFNLVIKALKP